MKDLMSARYVLAPDLQMGAPPSDEPDGIALWRAGSRGMPQLVSSDVRSLLAEFVVATTIPLAFRRFALRHQRPLDELVRDGLVSVVSLVDSGILLDHLSPQIDQITSENLPDIPGYLNFRCFRRLDDITVFSAADVSGARVAVKMATLADDREAAERITREAHVLSMLGGHPFPRLLAKGSLPVPYVVMEWCPGQTLYKWIGRAKWYEALSISSHLLKAIEKLHTMGFSHGDLNPGNIIATTEGVNVIDFGDSESEAMGNPGPPKGVLQYQAPENLVKGGRIRGDRFKADQYSVAVLIYELLTGQSPINFSEDREEACHQAMSEVPRAFCAVGVAPFGKLEEVLMRALSKDPDDRYCTLKEFHREWDALAISTTVTPSGFADGVRKLLAPGGDWGQHGLGRSPSASLHSGSAGIATCLLEVARREQDPSVLSSALAWGARALREVDLPGGFVDTECLLLDTWKRGCSLLHTSTGVHYTRVLLAHAASNPSLMSFAIRDFLNSICMDVDGERGAVQPDFATGTSGLLGALAELNWIQPSQPVADLGNTLFDDCMHRLRAPSFWEPGPINIGFAHGLSGFLWSMSRWIRASGRPVPREFETWIDRLTQHGMRDKRGLLWPQKNAARVFIPGWCNGSAGIVLAFCEFYQLSKNDEYIRVARETGRPLVEHRWRSGHICCGAAGGAIALAELLRRSGEQQWLRGAARARDAALAMESRSSVPGSLFGGDVGALWVAVPDHELQNLHLPGFSHGALVSSASPVWVRDEPVAS